MPTFAIAKSGFSAVGSAHVWGARGRWFESSNPDLGGKKLIFSNLPPFLYLFSLLFGIKKNGKLALFCTLSCI